MSGPARGSSIRRGCSGAPASAWHSPRRSGPWDSTMPMASTGWTSTAAPPPAGSFTSNSATSSDAHYLGDVYEACGPRLPGAARCHAGAGANPLHLLAAAVAQGRVREFARDPAAHAGLRGRGIDLQPRGAGLPRRGAKAAAIARLGGAGLRPAVDRPVPHGEDGQAA